MKTPSNKLSSCDRFIAPPDNLGSSAIAGGEARSQSLTTLIEQQSFFAGLNARHLKWLTDSAMEMQFQSGESIFQEGSPANRFYLILEGSVVLESDVEERGTFPIATLGPGDYLGWSWLSPPYLLHTSARALSPTRTIFFYGTRLREQCEHDHDLGYQLMLRITEVVVRHLEATQQRLTECIVTHNLSNG